MIIRLPSMGCRTARMFAAILVATAPWISALAFENVYMGVSTCANSTCHGAPTPLPGSIVEQNEFLVWKQHDRHANSFAALNSDRGHQIAKHMGLSAPQQASECLGCHANNVAQNQRGRGFRIEDGVGCETCHGPASNWLGTHSSGSATRSENIAAGMYPTHDPSARAQLCLGCHMFKDNDASQHRYYAAGHPRLRFELDTYTEERPGHHRIDADYRRRKPGSYGARSWILGQAAASKKIVQRLAQTGDQGLWPDYAVFACFGCHRNFSGGQEGTGGLPPLQDAHIEMTIAALTALKVGSAPALETALARTRTALQSKGQKGWREALKDLSQKLDSAESVLRQRPEAEADAGIIFKHLLTVALAGGYARHHLAEQASYALATLRQADSRLSSHEPGSVDAGFDVLFRAAGQTSGFDPKQWRAAVQSLSIVLAPAIHP